MPLAYPPFKSCPCGTGRSYAHCCGPRHDGSRPAEQPEELMRARYSAYFLGDAAFVLRTWHPGTRPHALDLKDGTRFLGLRVHEAHGDEVEFTATLKLADGTRYRLRERSTFAPLDGGWVYVDGVRPPELDEEG